MASDDATDVSKFDDTYSILSDEAPKKSTNGARRTTNTGPKGVRADARAYEASKRDAGVMNKLKNVNFLNRHSRAGSGGESETDEDKWMSRWREQRMKELSKTGVAGVNLFGQVDDVDAAGYLAAVDFEESDSPDDNPKRSSARRNVVNVVLIYDNVTIPLFKFLTTSLPIQRPCFNCFRTLLDGILRRIFYGCRRSMLRTCRLARFLPF
jgi:hypothetical protein